MKRETPRTRIGNEISYYSSIQKSFSTSARSHSNESQTSLQIRQKNPRHPSLQFKKIKSSNFAYSVRIDLDYRAIGARKEDTIIWFWIGSHDDYEKMMEAL